MAFDYLNAYGSIWQASGLKYLLLEEEAPSVSGVQSEVGKTNAARDIRTAKYDIPEPCRDTAGECAGGEVASWHPVPVKEWPRNWQKELELARKGLVAWTYWELGEDLQEARKARQGGTGSSGEHRKARSQLLRRIIKDLAQPAGTHTFWPVSLPAGTGREHDLNADVFWSGLSFLGCRGVIVLGSRAARALLDVPNLRPLMRLRTHDQFVWILWEAESLFHEDMKYQRMLTFLRQSLRPFIRA